jgi:hypothetical protein
LQGGSHPGQQHGVDVIGLGESAGCLSDSPYKKVRVVTTVNFVLD